MDGHDDRPLPKAVKTLTPEEALAKLGVLPERLGEILEEIGELHSHMKVHSDFTANLYDWGLAHDYLGEALSSLNEGRDRVNEALEYTSRVATCPHDTRKRAGLTELCDSCGFCWFWSVD